MAVPLPPPVYACELQQRSLSVEGEGFELDGGHCFALVSWLGHGGVMRDSPVSVSRGLC
jgi:hypothetical protein